VRCSDALGWAKVISAVEVNRLYAAIVGTPDFDPLRNFRLPNARFPIVSIIES